MPKDSDLLAILIDQLMRTDYKQYLSLQGKVKWEVRFSGKLLMINHIWMSNCLSSDLDKLLTAENQGVILFRQCVTIFDDILVVREF